MENAKKSTKKSIAVPSAGRLVKALSSSFIMNATLDNKETYGVNSYAFTQSAAQDYCNTVNDVRCEEFASDQIYNPHEKSNQEINNMLCDEILSKGKFKINLYTKELEGDKNSRISDDRMKSYADTINNYWCSGNANCKAEYIDNNENIIYNNKGSDVNILVTDSKKNLRKTPSETVKM